MGISLGDLIIKTAKQELAEKKKAVPQAQAQEVKVSPVLAKIYNEWRGKLICLFGDYNMGKTTFSAHLSKTAWKLTNKPPLYIALDLNLQDPDLEKELVELLGRQNILYIEPHAFLEMVLIRMGKSMFENRSIIVVDSVTEIWSWIIQREARYLGWKFQRLETLNDPRAEEKKIELIRKLARRPDLKNEYTTYLEIIAVRLKQITNDCHIPAILIAHPTPIFNSKDKDPDLRNFWDEIGMRPAYMSKALRRVSKTYLAVLEGTLLKLIEISTRGLFPKKLGVIRVPAKEYEYNRLA